MLPFLELFGRFLADPEVDGKETLDLLQSTPEALVSIQDPQFAESYHSRLYAGMEWCVNIANTIYSSLKRPSTSSSAQPRSVTSSQPRAHMCDGGNDGRRTSSALPNSSASPPPPPSKAVRRPTPTESSESSRKRVSAANRPSSTMEGFFTFTSSAVPTNNINPNTSSDQFSSSFRADFPLFPLDRPPLSPLDLMPDAEQQTEQDDRGQQGFGSRNTLDAQTLPQVPNTRDVVEADKRHPVEVFYKAGTLDDFMPRAEALFEPWDTDIPNDFLVSN